MAFEYLFDIQGSSKFFFVYIYKVKWSSYRPGVAQRVGRGIDLLYHDRGTRRGWVVSSTPRLVWTRGKSRPHRDSIYIYIYIYIYTHTHTHTLLGRLAQSVLWLTTGWTVRDRIPVVPGFSPVQTGPGAHLASCTMGTGSFPGVNCGRGVLLTTHPLLVPRSWKSRGITLPTLWATPGL